MAMWHGWAEVSLGRASTHVALGAAALGDEVFVARPGADQRLSVNMFVEGKLPDEAWTGWLGGGARQRRRHRRGAVPAGLRQRPLGRHQTIGVNVS
jgi:hypothetical protein